MRSVAVLEGVELAGVAGGEDDAAVAPRVKPVDLPAFEPGDLTAFLGVLVDFEELALGAGADVEAVLDLQQAQNEAFFAEEFAGGAVEGDAVDRVFAAAGSGEAGRGGKL